MTDAEVAEAGARALCKQTMDDPELIEAAWTVFLPSVLTVIAAVRPLIEAQERERAWQDISTVPRISDGAWLLLWVQPSRLNTNDEASVVVATWDDISPPACWIDERGRIIHEIATHWMLLPAPPIRAMKPAAKGSE